MGVERKVRCHMELCKKFRATSSPASLGDALYTSRTGALMQSLPAQFEDQAIRRVYDEKAQTWWFSVVDIVQVLTQQPDPTTARKYWHKLKERLRKEGSELVTVCHQVKLPTSDGKNYLSSSQPPARCVPR